MDTNENGREQRRKNPKAQAQSGRRQPPKAAQTRQNPRKQEPSAAGKRANPGRKPPVREDRKKSAAGKEKAADRKRQEHTRRRRTSKAAVPKRQKKPTPDVVYTPAIPMTRGRLLLRLATVVAVVLALTFSISIFFKVQTITVSGTEKYTPWQVAQASGIAEGDNLLMLSKPKASGRIQVALPYVDEVRFRIELPGTVHIEVRELDAVYAVRDSENNWWLMTAQGRLIEKTDNAGAGERTMLTGVVLEKPVAGETAVAREEQSEETPVVTTAAEKLSTALSIFQYLEQNGILGEAASLDVSDLGNMELWYGQKFQVSLGDATQLSYKITCMKAAIDSPRMKYESGVLDVSFTIMPDQVMYTPFASEG